jgi:hypothetical protein
MEKPMVETNNQPEMRMSPKSFGTAVSLCVIFGPVGIHHFYLGNWLHGLFDLALLVLAIFCFLSADPAINALGGLLILIDYLHTIYVSYKLIVGECRDGGGRLVVYPGQLD